MTGANKPAGSARPVTAIEQRGQAILAHTPTVRVKSYEDMTPWALLCAAGGRHLGFLLNDPVVVPAASNWGTGVDAREVHYWCDCTRWRYEVLDWRTKEVLSRSVQYGGGVLLETGGRQRDAKGVWLEQVEQRRADAIAKADAEAELEERAALEEHVQRKIKRRHRKDPDA